MDLRQEIRACFNDVAGWALDQVFEGNPQTFTVTWDHILAATWPNTPKASNACKLVRGKPY